MITIRSLIPNNSLNSASSASMLDNNWIVYSTGNLTDWGTPLVVVYTLVRTNEEEVRDIIINKAIDITLIIIIAVVWIIITTIII